MKNKLLIAAAVIVGVPVGAIVLLVAAGAVLLVFDKDNAAEPGQPAAVAAPAPESSYQKGLKLGSEAAEAAQTAKTPEEWKRVFDKWVAARLELRKINTISEDYDKAQAKLAEYDKYMKVALDKSGELSDGEQEASAPATPARGSDLTRLREAIAQKDPDGALVTGVEVRGEDVAVFTVSTTYLAANDDVKLEVAKGLWTIWAGIHSPDKPDHAYIEVRTSSGTKIASSSMWGGSMVKLEK